MARPPAYRLYRGELATMQAGNDLQAMIEMAKMHEAVLGGKMVIKDAMAMWESCMYKDHPDANPCTHCCDWSDFVERIKEVLGDDN